MCNKVRSALFVLFVILIVGCNKTFTPTDDHSVNDKTITPDPLLVAFQDEIASGQEQGNNIIDSLENYYREKGSYPENLEELTPIYLEEIPTTSTDQSFYYKKHEVETYILSFPLVTKNGVVCGFSRRTSQWECSLGH